MFLILVLWLLGVISMVTAAAVHPQRQVQSTTQSSPTCPVTVTQYVTVTYTPPVVTVAIPISGDISRSLASASSVDSIVVVESVQNADPNAPPNTRIPTFVNTIVAPAFEATEISGSGSNVIYAPATSRETIPIGSTTISVIPQGVATPAADDSTLWVTVTSTPAVLVNDWNGTTSSDTDSSMTTFPEYTIGTSSASVTLVNDWNGTITSSAIASSASVTLVNDWNGTISSNTVESPATTLNATAKSSVSTTTAVSYVATVISDISVTTTTTVSSSAPAFFGGYSSVLPSLMSWPSKNSGIVKRQTCVLISGDVGNFQTATWCNNWDGVSALTYTSWETTITPGHVAAKPTSSGSSMQSSSVVTSALSSASATTVESSVSPTSPSQGVVPAQASTTVSMTTSASATASSCGQVGTFDINFDDLPAQSVFANETAALPPIFNPFDHFFWEAGWSYGPPPSVPYTPHNGNQLAIYNTSLSGNESAGSVVRGGFSAGPRSSLNQYWFNATSAWIGCQNNLTAFTGICDFVAEGYVWNEVTQQEQLVVTQHFAQTLCETEHCDLQFITFEPQFTGLCTMSFYANINGVLRDFYVDDMQMGWWNNTCEAGQMRISSRK